jgi:cell division protein FtsL
MKKGPPVIRAGLLFLLLLGSLTLVVWRQSRALEMQRSLEAVRRERVVEEARRTALLRRVEQLESRTRVSEAAGARLGMRLPAGTEIVILPMSIPGGARLVGGVVAGSAVAAAGGEGG